MTSRCVHGFPMDHLCLLCLDAMWNAKPFNPLPRLTKPERTNLSRSEWYVWCAKYGIDPNTPSPTLLDDYLHGRTPAARPEGRNDTLVTQSGTQRQREIAELERWLRL